ncbi:MAG: MBL fold metallo-hydrolase [Muribaculaceae bacterium]|nr:MBL fold metallo-hydrolase [Muribaculaceae bacterium]
MLKVSKFIFNMFGVNTYVVWDFVTLEAAIVDPGMIDVDECKALADFVERNNLKLKYLVNTHMHLDHVFGNAWVSDKYGLKIHADRREDDLGRNLSLQARMFGMNLNLPGRGVDVELKDGDLLTLGDEKLKVLSVPGHSPGSIALWSEADGFVITGDALFRQSIGRTDLPGGDHATLISSIRNKLLTLPDSTVVLPGHGDETTIGWEKTHNYMLM